jgi:hypothetical protein
MAEPYDFWKELRSVLADCSEFLEDCGASTEARESDALSDRCESMLAQVVAQDEYGWQSIDKAPLAEGMQLVGRFVGVRLDWMHLANPPKAGSSMWTFKGGACQPTHWHPVAKGLEQ